MMRLVSISASLFFGLAVLSCSSSGRGGGDAVQSSDVGGSSDIGGGGGDVVVPGDTGGGSDAGAVNPVCVDWFQFMVDTCGLDAFTPEEACAAIVTLGSNAGCTAQYEAMYACLDTHRSEWVCEPSFCPTELQGVSSCIIPYCTEHPAECEGL